MKKFLTFILVLAMVLSVSSVAMAAVPDCSNGITCTVHEAAIGTTHYDTLQEAVDAAQDGDTIILLTDVKYTSSNAITDGTWKDGLVYTGDKSFTIDLNGKSISDNGDLNDYLVYFKNKGSKANEITLINGTISGGASLWNVITVGAASTNATVLNLGNNLTVKGDGSNNPGEDGVVKVRNGSTVNVKSGAKIISDASAMYCIQAATASNDNAYVNIYDGAELVMNMSGGSAVSGTGTVNIYGGTITSAGWGVFTSSTGAPKFTISGGSISGNAGAVASCADFNSDSDAAPEVSITGGTLSGKISVEEYGASTEGDAKLTVSGGAFTEDPSAYVPANVLEATVNDGTSTKYTVGEKSTEEAAAAIPDGATDTKVTIKDKQGVGNVDLDLDPDKVDSIAIPNDAMAEKIKINGQKATVDPSGAPVPAPTAPPTTKPSTGSGYSGPDVWYIGGNTFGTSTTQSPSKVEIDGVAVPFTMNGSKIVVGCVDPNAHWVKASWGSTTNTVYFTPDAQAFCAQTVIPKTGDMPIWAAVAAFFGF